MDFEEFVRSGVESLELWPKTSTKSTEDVLNIAPISHGNAVATHSDRMYILTTSSSISVVNLAPSDGKMPVYAKVCDKKVISVFDEE